ncbi:magnesium transporter MRS2-I-like [Quercus robur]|uniref:magnesium transporter MRS2-I-like n=1 Tax=Quercus robur TaxID=38942 RepID=UPI002161B7AE|nr:magnesium transporter MRS2-I-like [Quercus robur]
MGRDGYVVPADPGAGAAMISASANVNVNLKKKNQSARSWILLDSRGEGTNLDVDKYAIMHRVHIHARDLRILDPLLSYPSTILGRDKAIVLNLEHIKAIITAEEVLLRDPSDENVIPVVEELQRRLPPANAIPQGLGDGKEYPGGQHDVDAGEEDESPFEFRALEVALEAICSFLAARTTELETDAYPALDELTSKISSRNLDRVRKLKSAMTRLTARVQKVRDELEQLLDDDDDMADLYLSRKLAGTSSPVSGSGAANWFAASPTIGSKISRASRASVVTVRGDENDVEELEMLLEAYFMQIDGTLNKLTTLREYIDDTEDYINIQLDNHRNQLIQLELFLSSGTVCLSIYSLVAGIFGMNIPYTWNNNYGYMFKWVIIVSGAICAFLFTLIISYARYKGLVGS